MASVVNITNIPAPYRERIHELLAENYGSNYTVVYCAKTEPNREWKFPYRTYNKLFLTEEAKGFIHNNISIWSVLQRLKPSVVITIGFNPTMLYGFLWCKLVGAKHICFADGTLISERNLSWVHRLVRKIVYRFSHAYIGASEGSKQLYLHYNVPVSKIFRTYYV
jgi:hypothetical protein